jgi:hypothetical protein
LPPQEMTPAFELRNSSELKKKTALYSISE